MGQSRVWWIGGVVAGAVMIVFGIVVIVLALNGQSTVKSELKNQQITPRDSRCREHFQCAHLLERLHAHEVAAFP